MADKNRNLSNQNYQSYQDMDQNRSRYGREDEQQNYFGNTYNAAYDREDYNRGGSMNSNYNRQYGNNDRDYDNDYRNDYGNRYGGGNYGNQYGGGDYEREGYRGMYGNTGNYSGYNRGNRANYDRDYDYDRGYGNTSRSANYGRNYGNAYNRGDRHYQGRNRDWLDKASDEISSWFGDEDAERRRRMDKVSGPHRGKGPKGYQRSDERIREDINDRLSDDPYIDASEIEVKVANHDVILSGTVESREAKRRAEDIAESVSGVSNVENHLHINRGDNDYTTKERSKSNFI